MGLESEIRDPKKSIPDPGVKKASDPRSRIRIRNTGSGLSTLFIQLVILLWLSFIYAEISKYRYVEC